MKRFFVLLFLTAFFLEVTVSTDCESDCESDCEAVRSAREDAHNFKAILDEKLKKSSGDHKRKKRMLDLDVVEVGNKENDPPICIGCVAGVNLIQYYIATGKKTPEIINMMYTMCVGTKYKPPKYCEELTNLIGPEIVEILSNTTNTPREVCSFVFSMTCGNGDVPNHRWSIQLPNKPKPPMKPRVPPKEKLQNRRKIAD